MNFKYALLTLAASTALLMTACDDDDPIEEENEEELITTVALTLVGSDASTRVYTFTDLDGEGGADGTTATTGDDLDANTTYTYSLIFRNDIDSEDITAEIREEDEEHQVFFSATGVDLAFAPSDEDRDGNPLGLVGTVTTGDAGDGTMTVTLRHEPNKDADGVSDGDITNAGGETDIQVTFDVEVE